MDTHCSVFASLTGVMMFLMLAFSRLTTSNASILSSKEPDWSIAKADLVDELYSYEPYIPGKEFRGLFSLLRPSASTSNFHKTIPKPLDKSPSPTVLQNKANQSNNGRTSAQPNKSKLPASNKEVQGQVLPQAPLPHQQVASSEQNNRYIPPAPAPPTPVSPVYAKFSMNDKKLGLQQQQQQQHQQQLQNDIRGLVPPHNPHPSLTLPKPAPQDPIYHNVPKPKPQYPPPRMEGLSRAPKLSQGNGENNLPDATAVDSQTIIWPENVEQRLMTNDEETQVRFLVHKAGDEEIIKDALATDGNHRNQDVKFIEGPMLRIQRHQKVYLPPKRKTVVYILLKEPQIVTDVEVVGPTEEPVPEVFITYQKSDGGVKTKHYSPEVVKNDKYLSQLRQSATSFLNNDSKPGNNTGIGDQPKVLYESPQVVPDDKPRPVYPRSIPVDKSSKTTSSPICPTTSTTTKATAK